MPFSWCYTTITNKAIGGINIGKEWILMVQQNQLGNLLKTNQKTEKFGLSISEQDAEMILQERKNALQEQKRIEFGEGIVQKLFMSSVIQTTLIKTTMSIRLSAFKKFFIFIKMK